MPGEHIATEWGLALILGVPGLLAALLTAYLLAVSIASFFYHPVRRPLSASRRIDVLIPAHNEEAVIARCLTALLAQSYPKCLYRIIVIADNCTDATVDLATAMDVDVMVRSDRARLGKGYALRWAIDRIQSEAAPPDAFVIVDADSIADRHLLTELADELNSGSEVVQAEYLALPEAGARAQLAATAFLLFHRVRFAGRAALGMPANLVGNGMLLSRRVLERHPWDAFLAVEDLEYSVRLRLDGIRPVFAGGARVHGPVASRGHAERTQRRRWEGGRLAVMRHWLPTLFFRVLVRGQWELLDEAIELAVPPLGLLAFLVLIGTSLSLGLGLAGLAPRVAALPWIVAGVAVPASVLVGMRAGRAPASAYGALLRAPLYLLRKVGLYVSLARSFDARRWEAAGRPDPGRRSGSRFTIAGVPVDALDTHQVLDRLVAAMGRKRRVQVCTVNVDFMVNAQRDPETRAIFQRAELNIPDGKPVVWLGRLLGHRVPERITGADLVPLLAESAAERGASLFLLGGEGGVAASAAARLRERSPGLRVAGHHEPPRARLEDMDHEGIVRRINESKADVLLVAFGNPKQDKWIARNRQALDVSIAIGVGCSFDLIAGRSPRAPQWMQAAGLEWLYRLKHEPRRLFTRYLVDAGWLLTAIPAVAWHRMWNSSAS